MHGSNTSKTKVYLGYALVARLRTNQAYLIACLRRLLVAGALGRWKRSSQTGKQPFGFRGGRFGIKMHRSAGFGVSNTGEFQKFLDEWFLAQTWNWRARGSVQHWAKSTGSQKNIIVADSLPASLAQWRRSIRTGRNVTGITKDLVLNGVVPELATFLLDACQSAWVFGGMGSWNDMSFEGADQAEYDRLSEELFNTLNETIQTAANASCAYTP